MKLYNIIKLLLWIAIIANIIIIIVVINNNENNYKAVEINNITKEAKIEINNEIAYKEIKDLKIDLQDIDGQEKNYTFTYMDENFEAIYTTDNWHIVDSYKILNKEDMAIICQELINVHPIHGKDMTSYRTAEDMADEWSKHNIVYYLISKDNIWKENAKDVDLDPEDQGRTIKEIYDARVNK